MNHTEYCNNRMARQNASCHIESSGTIKYSLNGVIYTKEEFDEKFPITGILTRQIDKRLVKGEHLDSRTKW